MKILKNYIEFTGSFLKIYYLSICFYLLPLTPIFYYHTYMNLSHENRKIDPLPVCHLHSLFYFSSVLSILSLLFFFSPSLQHVTLCFTPCLCFYFSMSVCLFLSFFLSFFLSSFLFLCIYHSIYLTYVLTFLQFSFTFFILTSFPMLLLPFECF